MLESGLGVMTNQIQESENVSLSIRVRVRVMVRVEITQFQGRKDGEIYL